MKRIILALLLCCTSFAFAMGTKDKGNQDYIASTSWTAAFADLAGIDDVQTVAPVTLRHPPEYEITVSDIEAISARKYFIYAGFERMMQTMGTSVGSVQMVQITCDNSIATVQKNAQILSEIAGTQEKSKERVARYVAAVKAGAAQIEAMGYKGARVLCNKNQVYLAKELGLTVAATFGPGPVTAEQIADVKKNGYVLIIDNVHNPVAQPLVEVSPKSVYVIWRNFPEAVEPDALLHVIEANINALVDSLK